METRKKIMANFNPPNLLLPQRSLFKFQLGMIVTPMKRASQRSQKKRKMKVKVRVRTKKRMRWMK